MSRKWKSNRKQLQRVKNKCKNIWNIMIWLIFLEKQRKKKSSLVNSKNPIDAKWEFWAYFYQKKEKNKVSKTLSYTILR